MKRYIEIFFASVALAFSLASCSQDQLGVTAGFNDDDNREIHFLQTSMSKEFSRDTKEGVIAITLARQGNKGTYRVLIEKSGKDASLFTLKDTVTIPDGYYTVDVPVRVNMAGVVLGSSIDVSLAIVGRDAGLGNDPAYIGQYSDFLSLSASFALEWEPYMRTNEQGEQVQQTATYYFAQFYTGYQSGILVEKAKDTDNIFRLVDWGSGTSFMFKVNWSAKTVVIPGQSIGYYDESAGQYVKVADLAQYLGDDSYYSMYPCTWDGDRTFTINVVYYVDAGIYGYGEEKIVFSGDHDEDPAVTVEYEGAGKFSFEYNDFATSCKAVVVDGDITADKDKVQEIYRKICIGEAEGVRTFTDATQTWTPASLSNTLVVVPFDEKGVPGSAVAVRFTYDPEGAVTPEVLECVLSGTAEDPYTTVQWLLKTKNVTSARFVMMEKDVLEYYISNYDLELIYSRLGQTLSASDLESANGEDGLKLFYQNAVEGTEYMLRLEVSNNYGDTNVVEATVKLAAHSDSYDKSKTIDDFLGSFLLSATVLDSDSQTSSEAFRVDIIKTGDNTVSIKGLCNYKTYSPEVTGTYIPEEHCIRLHSQSLPATDYMSVVFGFVSSLYTGIWGQTSALEFGYGDDGYIYWRAMEGSEMPVNGYKFLLFDGGSYSGYAVGGKSYSDLLMVKL